MLNLLFSLIFYVINFIADTLLAPVLLVLNIFAGDDIVTTGSSLYYSISQFLNIVMDYILFASDILCIPRSMFVFFFTIIIALITFIVGLRFFIFAISIYRHFKP